jgi:putative FmdB family regulatory protein
MPIYEYACTACDHRTDILHGLNDPGPLFCPSCGKEGTMRKLFAPPTIHFKGSGWAKKDRSGSSASRSSASAKSDGGGAPAGGDTGSSSDAGGAGKRTDGDSRASHDTGSSGGTGSSGDSGSSGSGSGAPSSGPSAGGD